MLTVISGIFVTPFALATCHDTILVRRSRHLAQMSSSAKADDPVFRAGHVHVGVTAYWMLAFAGMTV
jgi:hypothetical protein